MTKKEEFKLFARKHPELIDSVKNNQMTWQKFYEIYDIYGEESDVWDSYLQVQTSSGNGILDLANKLKNVDAEVIQGHIENAQKALGVLSELTSGVKDVSSSSVTPKVPRPINKFFED